MYSQKREFIYWIIVFSFLMNRWLHVLVRQLLADANHTGEKADTAG